MAIALGSNQNRFWKCLVSTLDYDAVKCTLLTTRSRLARTCSTRPVSQHRGRSSLASAGQLVRSVDIGIGQVKQAAGRVDREPHLAGWYRTDHPAFYRGPGCGQYHPQDIPLVLRDRLGHLEDNVHRQT